MTVQENTERNYSSALKYRRRYGGRWKYRSGKWRTRKART